MRLPTDSTNLDDPAQPSGAVAVSTYEPARPARDARPQLGALRIEDHALLGDTRTAALVGRDGSIDWLCVPDFDGGACFAALLGDARHGRFRLAPVDELRSARRRYRDDTMVLETEHATATGRVRIVDCLATGTSTPTIVRIVEGIEGRVRMAMDLVIRFDYGAVLPWVRTVDGTLIATAGPDTLTLHTPVETRGQDLTTVADFEVRAGERVPFVLAWSPSHAPAPRPKSAAALLRATERGWRAWSAHGTYDGEWKDAVSRSLLTLKALIYAPTGGMIAAPTTSLPERLGGVRNWDYRFCWIRDATFALYALMSTGFLEEARAWRDWLLRAAAGSPAELQTLYGIRGERRSTELELDWLPGHHGSLPVRIGNAAVAQFQLDIYGELLDCMHVARRSGLEPEPAAWALERRIVEHVESCWTEPDRGIWEVRGLLQHFTHSKVMAWVALDRAVKAVERFGLDGPLERWRQTRATIHEQVCRAGFDAEQNTFTQGYGSKRLDASLLMIPLVGFLPPEDPRVRGTVAAIERGLVLDGLLLRYSSAETEDGLPPGEGLFLPCSFWLADNYVLQGRLDEARALFERLLSVRNDVGLLSEEWDPAERRQLGNFPQALTHMALVNTAVNLSRPRGSAEHRSECGPED